MSRTKVRVCYTARVGGYFPRELHHVLTATEVKEGASAEVQSVKYSSGMAHPARVELTLFRFQSMSAFVQGAALSIRSGSVRYSGPS